MALKFPLDVEKQMEQLRTISQPDVDQAQALYIRSIFCKELDQPLPRLNGQEKEFERILFGLETVGFDLTKRVSIGALPDEFIQQEFAPWNRLVWPAYRVRRAMSCLLDTQNGYHRRLNNLFVETLNGLLSHRQPELRLRLRDIDLSIQPPSDISWDGYLELEMKRAFLLSARKSGGYRDLDQSSDIINQLRNEQATREKRLSDIQDPIIRQTSAIRALALYNCAKAVELTNDFLRGSPQDRSRRRITSRGIKDQIDRFIFNAREIVNGFDPFFRKELGKLGQACHSLIDASVFSITLPRSVRNLVNQLASRQTENPILELWFAQREAINARLLDPTTTAVVVSLPTSSGKTLLAELAVIQAYEDDPESRIVYLAPTRALVTQVSLTLRRDLQGLGPKIRVATPVFELNPVESDILRGDYNVLVTTPEKLDLLIKTNHESVENLSLVVVDEAHNMAEEERGARLELLLATLRRERDCRFLLLTPFAKNARELSFWLGEKQGAHIVLDWKPNDRVVGVFKKGRKKPKASKRPLLFHSLESVHSDCPAEVEIDLGNVPENTTTKERIAIEGTRKWASVKTGGVLLLAASRSSAVERAKSLAQDRPEVNGHPSIDLVCRFLDTEAGGDHPLSYLLKRGVAFHHAGLSPEARYFVERLVEEGSISIICATTTLAQGVDFPLSATVIEGYHRRRKIKGQWVTEEIRPWELWNIAGRVGRTLQDSVGTVAFASRTADDTNKIQEFLNREANMVVSSLIDTLAKLEGQDVTFGIDLVNSHKSLSAFLQFLMHALAIVGEELLREELEDLLRSSLAYLEAQKESQAMADQLIRLARKYIDDLEHRKGSRLDAFAKLADGTGFSSPSVDKIFSDWRNQTQLFEWKAADLFPVAGKPSSTLSDVMRTLGTIPEIRLGDHEIGTFNPVRIARITTAWVNGRPLIDIATDEYNGDLLECTRHIYSAITNLVPWGLRAIQKVSFAGRDDVEWAEMDLIPSMVFHGVRSREAIALRMLNVPRFLAENMATRIRELGIPLDKIDTWLSEASKDEWTRSLPIGASIKGPECKLLWEIIDGHKPWRSINEMNMGNGT